MRFVEKGKEGLVDRKERGGSSQKQRARARKRRTRAI